MSELDRALHKTSDLLAPGDLETIAWWAHRWAVNPLTILAAMHRVGPRMRDVTVEVWKTV